jgi:coenzyme F420-0:L-glutamate ligase/coenzyme F420-1:gamma-L-glutamate ligase
MEIRGEIRAIPVTGLPEIPEGFNLGAAICSGTKLAAGDIVVISQKAVSKSEGRLIALETVSPGKTAEAVAERMGKDPRIVELILGESRAVVREDAERGILITETHQGLICANSGIDSSNLPHRDTVLLLPEDADNSARRIRSEFVSAGAPPVAVLITDSLGRAWRLGQSEVAIGCAGINPLEDWRGMIDSDGRELSATVIATADQIAGAADLARNKTSRTPAVVVRGLASLVTQADGPGSTAQIRPESEDLFR